MSPYDSSIVACQRSFTHLPNIVVDDEAFPESELAVAKTKATGEVTASFL